jgi:hypothetical protein
MPRDPFLAHLPDKAKGRRLDTSPEMQVGCPLWAQNCEFPSRIFRH